MPLFLHQILAYLLDLLFVVMIKILSLIGKQEIVLLLCLKIIGKVSFSAGAIVCQISSDQQMGQEGELGEILENSEKDFVIIANIEGKLICFFCKTLSPSKLPASAQSTNRTGTEGKSKQLGIKEGESYYDLLKWSYAGQKWDE